MSHPECQQRRDAITLLVMGELGRREEAELRAHLAGCRECTGLYEELAREELALRDDFHDIARFAEPRCLHAIPRCGHMECGGNDTALDRPAGIQSGVTAAALHSAAPDCAQSFSKPAGAGQSRPDDRSRPRILAFRHRFAATTRTARPAVRVAVAAALVFALVSLFNWSRWAGESSGVAFADVLGRIDSTRTVRYVKTILVEGQEPAVYEQAAMDPGLLRSVQRDGSVTVCDFACGRQIVIDPGTRTAEVSRLVQPDSVHFADYLGWIKSLHEDGCTFIGQATIDGKPANVFAAANRFERTTVWVDPQTHLPVRIERVHTPSRSEDVKVPSISIALSDFQNEPAAAESQPTAATQSATITAVGTGILPANMTIVLSDLAWDVELDESDFSTVPPEGYQVRQVDYGTPPVGQDSLVEALRFWAEASDGAFPADINMLLEARPKLVRQFHKNGPAEQEYAEALKMANTIVQGLLFAQTLKTEDNWHYAGAHVALGQAEKPLCWWKNDEATYRVIYGDLRIRDVAAESLPKAEQP